MKLKIFTKYASLFSLTFATLLAGLLTFNHLENKKTLQSNINDQKILNEKLITFKKALQNKLIYSNSLISEKSSQQEELRALSTKIQQMNFVVQDDFDRFEILYSKLNQLIGNQAIAMNESKRSLFSNEKYLRSMEAYDLAVDTHRKEISKLTFQMNNRLSQLKFDPFLTANLDQNPIFKIDQLILSTK